MAGPADPFAPNSPARAKSPIPWPSIASFVLAFVIAAVSFFSFVLGSRIDVKEPSELYIYRQGVGDRTTLAFALSIPIINKASAYNDVLLSMEMQPFEGAPWFPRRSRQAASDPSRGACRGQ
jgi:hypothetical protein